MSRFNKIVLILVSILVVLTAIVSAMIFSNSNKQEEANEKKETKVSEIILDECTEEYEKLQNKTITTAVNNSKKVNENKDNDKSDESFLIKELDGKIIIYKIEKSGEEVLYEKTEISTEYLPNKDRVALKEGIRIQGKEKLNEYIEDFE